MKRFLFIVLSVLGAINVALCQTDTATISGRVTDPSGAAISGATLQVQNVLTDREVTVTTSTGGLYVVAGLLPGTYRIVVSSPGFKQIVKPDVVLNVQGDASLNFAMTIGSALETVTVEAGAPLLDTVSATVSTVVDRNFAENLPLNGRTFQSLIELAPGVVATASSYANQGQFSVNGQRTDTNYFTVDGVSANAGVGTGGAINSAGGGALPLGSAFGGFNNLISIDALQEFRIQSSTFAPEFGRTPGAQVSLISRSGTNMFHGSVFNYFRNNALDAADWFANANHLPQPALRQNDFGGVLDGPIVKDKLFFLVSYEGLRETFAVPSFMGVPSLCARANATSASNAPNATGTLMQWLNAYPLPNGPDIPEVFGLTCHDLNPALPTTNKLVSQFNANLPTTSTLDAGSLRVDYNLRSRMNVFFRFNRAPSASTVRTGAEVTSTAINAQTITLGQTYSIRPTLVNDLRFNYSTAFPISRLQMTSYAGAVPVPDSAIFPAPYSAHNGEYLFNPGFGGSVMESLGSGTAVSNEQHQFNIVNSVSYVAGNHQPKFGVDWRQLTPLYSAPPFQIINNFGAPEALPFGGFFPGGLDVAVNSPHGEQLRYENYSIYGQDTWRLKSKLTLTYGLRWEINPPPTSPNGTFLLAINQFTPSNLMAIQTLPLGASLYRTTWGNIAPRIGVAYSLSDSVKWSRVLRGGVGSFYDTASNATSFINGPYFPQKHFFDTNFPIPPTAPPGQPALLPLPQVQTTPPYIRAVDTTDPNLHLPRVYQFNAAFEQNLGTDQTVSVTYVGAIGRKMIRQDVYSSSSLSPAYFSNDLSVYRNDATSDYHGLQVVAKRRLSHGLQGFASYTWSHSIDSGSAFNVSTFPAASVSPNLDRGNSDFDIRHQFNFAISYNLPSQLRTRGLSSVLGHWSVDVLSHFRTAVPLTLTSPAFNYTDSAGATYSVTLRSNVVPGQAWYVYGSQCAAIYGSGTTNGIIGNGSLGPGQSCPGGVGLNPAAFVAVTAPAAGAPIVQGDLPRNAVRSFGAAQFDLALRRDFRISEAWKLEFRADLFNAVNHPNFGPPIENTVTNSAPLGSDFSSVGQGFGISQRLLNNALGSGNATNGGSGGLNPLYSLGGPRSVQLSLKLRF